MRSNIQGPFTCGTQFVIPGAVPTVSTKSFCQVPKGNYVQLDGRVSAESGPVWFAWDRVDAGAADYNDLNIPRFVPHFPTQRSSIRFLPNMYLLSFGLGTQKEEIPPKASVAGVDLMTFRFIARTRFDATATVANFDAALAGTFGYKDMTLTYLSSVNPLTLTVFPTDNFETSKQVTVNWTGGSGLTNNIEMLIAINTMQQVQDFDYEKDVVDLDWISMGVFPNNGAATVTVPALNPGSQPINVMIRSKNINDPETDDCYFFDMKTIVAAPVGGPVFPPMAAPPINTPTAPPTIVDVTYFLPVIVGALLSILAVAIIFYIW